jgi:hypothetical protein
MQGVAVFMVVMGQVALELRAGVRNSSKHHQRCQRGGLAACVVECRMCCELQCLIVFSTIQQLHVFTHPHDQINRNSA